MKALANLLILLCVLCFPLGLHAHQPDLSSTILVEQGKNQWLLQVRAALTAFEYEIETYFGEDAYATPEEFQALVSDFVKEHVSVRFNNGEHASLEKGMVKLGHETNVTFRLTATPEDVQFIRVTNTSFRDIPRNQSALLVLKQGYPKEQFTLSNSNGHTADLKLGDTELVLLAPAENEVSYVSFFLLVGGLLLLVFTYYVFRHLRTPSLVEA